MFLITPPKLPKTPHLKNFVFPKEDVVFAVGDIHGQAHLFEELLAAIKIIKTPGKTRHLVFTGDLIDRGPHSLQTLILASQAKDLAHVDNVVYLPGNHELLMCDSLDSMELDRNVKEDPVVIMWLQNGGAEFWREMVPKGTGSWKADSLSFRQGLPIFGDKRFKAAIRDWPSHFKMGSALFVHGGVAPGRPFSHSLDLGQARHLEGGHNGAHYRHWAWMNKPFLNWDQGWSEKGPGAPDSLSYIIFHGHTSVYAPPEEWAQAHHLTKTMSRIGKKSRVCMDLSMGRIGGVQVSEKGISLLAVS